MAVRYKASGSRRTVPKGVLAELVEPEIGNHRLAREWTMAVGISVNRCVHLGVQDKNRIEFSRLRPFKFWKRVAGVRLNR